MAPPVSRRDLLRGAAGLALGSVSASLWLPESARARSLSRPNSPTSGENTLNKATSTELTAEALPPGTFPTDARFQARWDQLGGLAQNGYALSPTFTEVAEDGKPYTVQYFERAKFELHPEQTDLQYQIMLTRLGVTEWEKTYPGRPTDATTPIDPQFTSYWKTHGGLYQQGLPLGPGEMLQAEDGQDYYTQFFERAVFEYHPEKAAEGFDVLLKRVGANELKRRYPGGVQEGTPEQQPGCESTLTIPRTESRRTGEEFFDGKSAGFLWKPEWNGLIRQYNPNADIDFSSKFSLNSQILSIDKGRKTAVIDTGKNTSLEIDVPDSALLRGTKRDIRIGQPANDRYFYGAKLCADFLPQDIFTAVFNSMAEIDQAKKTGRGTVMGAEFFQ